MKRRKGIKWRICKKDFWKELETIIANSGGLDKVYDINEIVDRLNENRKKENRTLIDVKE